MQTWRIILVKIVIFAVVKLLLILNLFAPIRE